MANQAGAMTQKNIFQVGAYAGSTPLGTDSTLFWLRPQILPGYAIPTLRHGFDLRDGAFNGYPFASPGQAVDGSGNYAMASLTTLGTVQAKTGIVSGVSIDTVAIVGTPGGGGLFYEKPHDWSIDAPPLGGTQAVLSIGAMGVHPEPAKSIASIISGANCHAGELVTEAGGTGTAPQWTIGTVDGGGKPLTWAVTTQGALTGALPSQPATLTGPNCTGLTAVIGYTILSGSVSISNGGTNYPIFPPPKIRWAPFNMSPTLANGDLAPWEKPDMTLTVTPAPARLQLNPAGGAVNLQLTTPASSSAACASGDFAEDASFVYVCTATNTWKRATLATF